jgi:tetratricopeptide (TPR) repeat protein
MGRKVARWIGQSKGCTILRTVSYAVLALMSMCGLSKGLYLAAQSAALPNSESDSSRSLLTEAKILVDSGKFGEAAGALKNILQTNPESASAHRMLAYSYLRMDDPKQSLEQYTEAAAIAHPSAEDLQNVSKDYVLLNDMSSAERWIKASLEIDDRAPESWYVFGRIRYTQRRLQDAVECFRRVLVLLPRSVKAEDNLGLSYEALNRRDDAVAAYRQAIVWQKDSHSSSEQPLLNLGILFMREGDLDQARPLLSDAAAMAPHSARTHEQLGHLYIDLHLYAKAESELGEGVKLDPKRAALHFLLGRAYHLGGDEDKARKEFAISSVLSGEHSTPEDR